MCHAIKQGKLLKPVWWVVVGQNINMGRSGRPIRSHSHKRIKASTMSIQLCKQLPVGWKRILCHMPPPKTVLCLEKQVLWWHDTSESIESDSGAYFQNNFMETWAMVCHWLGSYISYAAASGEIKWYNGLLKTTLRVIGGGIFKHRNTHLAKAMWLVNTRASTPPMMMGSKWTAVGHLAACCVKLQHLAGKILEIWISCQVLSAE